MDVIDRTGQVTRSSSLRRGALGPLVLCEIDFLNVQEARGLSSVIKVKLGLLILENYRASFF